MYTELHPDGSLYLFFNSLQEEQAGKYVCKGNYARNVELTKSVTIETISEYDAEFVEELSRFRVAFELPMSSAARGAQIMQFLLPSFKNFIGFCATNSPAAGES